MGNREALLKGALECLLDKGYASTTARDVAGRAGTSLAAIGYHFQSTEQLLHEAITDGFRQWRGHLAAIVEMHAADTPAGIIDAIGDELTRLFQDERSLLVVFLEAVALAERSEALQRQASAAYQEDRLAIASILQTIRGANRPDDFTLASALLAVVDGLFIQYLVSPTDTPSPKAVLGLFAPLLTGAPRKNPRKQTAR